MRWRGQTPVTDKLRTVYDHRLPKEALQWVIQAGDVLLYKGRHYRVCSVSRAPVAGAVPTFQLEEIDALPHRETLPGTSGV